MLKARKDYPEGGGDGEDEKGDRGDGGRESQPDGRVQVTVPVISARVAALATAVSMATTMEALTSTLAVQPWIASCTRQANWFPSGAA